MAAGTPSGAVFRRWVEEYVCQPHPEIGRPGPVCPFVPKLLGTEGFTVEIDDGPDGTDPAPMEVRMWRAVEDFLAVPLEPWRKAMVVLFPGVPVERGAIVDEVQGAMKPECVRRGLMVGQFHPHSIEGGARNPAFPANRAPVVSIALRHMSYHDIVFLDRSAEMFAVYRERYAEKIRDGDVEPFFVERYEAAAARFG